MEGRCETCKHWQKYQLTEWGRCIRASRAHSKPGGDPDLDLDMGSLAHAEGIYGGNYVAEVERLSTAPAFGCVMHEAGL